MSKESFGGSMLRKLPSKFNFRSLAASVTKKPATTDTSESNAHAEFTLFPNLPDDMVLLILSFLSTNDLSAFSLVSKACKRYAEHESIWREKVLRLFWRKPEQVDGSLNILRNGQTWRSFYMQATGWRWSLKYAAKHLVITKDRLTVSRPTIEGSNPAILADTPFTPQTPYFEVTLDALVDWVGIGVADHRYILNDSNTIGGQMSGFNSSYYWQAGTYLRCPGIPQEEWSAGQYKPKSMSLGDVIGIKVDDTSGYIYYFHNGECQGEIPYKRSTFYDANFPLFPAAALSTGTKLTLSFKYAYLSNTSVRYSTGNAPVTIATTSTTATTAAVATTTTATTTTTTTANISDDSNINNSNNNNSGHEVMQLNSVNNNSNISDNINHNTEPSHIHTDPKTGSNTNNNDNDNNTRTNASTDERQDQMVAYLVDMGFTPDAATVALVTHDMNVHAALDSLLSSQRT